MPVRRPALGAALLAALALSTAAPAGAQTPPSWLQLENGVSRAQFSFAEAIEQTVFVESPVDSDADGRNDRIRIRLSRPRETQTLGYDVPVVFEHSPYRGGTGSLANHGVDVDELPQEDLGARAATARERLGVSGGADLPGTLANTWVPRGYAVVLGESIGTFNSEGCPDVGAWYETLGTKAVIDWLNGRGRAWDAAGNPVAADWTTGDVGMVGGSYNGTLPNQVATTGVEGLRTIVPLAAISSWYDYYRANGLVVAPHSRVNGAGDNGFQGEDTDVLGAYIGGTRMNGVCAPALAALRARQDRVTGDWNAFWEARDYLGLAGEVRTSVFVVHGLNDWNVRTKQFAEWWYRLSALGVPRKLWLHTGGHSSPGGTDYARTLHRWFDHWLFGVPNGVASEPRTHVQRSDGSYVREDAWPAPGSRPVHLSLGATSATAPGTLSTRRSRAAVTQSFVDRGRELDTDDVLIQQPDTAHPNRLVYRSPALRAPVRLSGTPWVDLRMAVENRRSANLTAVLVDYGPDGSAAMVTRGWLDPQNRASLWHSRPLTPGRGYDLRWDLQPDDYVFAAGHRIGLVVVSTDYDYTLRPLPGTELSLDPARSVLRLPIVGGAAALGF